jgi:hypothetical protein
MLGSTDPILRWKSILMTAGCWDMRFPVIKPDKNRQLRRIRGCFMQVLVGGAVVPDLTTFAQLVESSVLEYSTAITKLREIAGLGLQLV